MNLSKILHIAISIEQTELVEVGIECDSICVDDYTDKKMTFFHVPDGLPLVLHE